MPSTAATTHSITSPCTCCWGNLSIWKYGSSTPQIPVWCCWCTSVWPTPALEKLCGCYSTTGMWKHLCTKNLIKNSLIYSNLICRAWFSKSFECILSTSLTGSLMSSLVVPTPWTLTHQRRCCPSLSNLLLRVRPAASPSAPSSSFLMASSRTWMKR